MNTLLMLIDEGYTITVMRDYDGIGDYDINVTRSGMLSPDGKGFDQSFKGDDVEWMIFDIAIKLLEDYKQ